MRRVIKLPKRIDMRIRHYKECSVFFTKCLSGWVYRNISSLFIGEDEDLFRASNLTLIIEAAAQLRKQKARTNWPRRCWIDVLREIVQRREFVDAWYKKLPEPYQAVVAEDSANHCHFTGVLKRLLTVFELKEGEPNAGEPNAGEPNDGELNDKEHKSSAQSWCEWEGKRYNLAVTPTKQNSPSQCRLLSLPHELRIRIYREALVQLEPVRLCNAEAQPALLCCCVQIRQEAIGTYYTYNTFDCRIAHHGPAAMLAFHDLVQRYDLYDHSLNVTYKFADPPKPCWPCLRLWLLQYHEGKVSDPTAFDPDSTYTRDVMPAFRIVAALKEQPWSTVEEVMEEVRVMLAERDARWNE